MVDAPCVTPPPPYGLVPLPPPPPRTRISSDERNSQKENVFSTQIFGLLGSRTPHPPPPLQEGSKKRRSCLICFSSAEVPENSEHFEYKHMQ